MNEGVGSGLSNGKQKVGRGEGENNLAMENPSGEKNADSSQPMNSSNERFVLRGWPLIEEWMTKLDEGMVRNFQEDINTLLTFAGLFSAVVTAFLIQLYLGLQPDSNQTTNNFLNQTTALLGQISQQIANSSIVPANITTPSPAFQASGSTIWISTLWFLSLILSLAAALFGMISKQWLREYLQWTTMSGPSENQVALRQARYEAFMDWKTPAIISSMPVLLEIALVIFLLGLEGLLWTLNIVVFSICTVAIVTLIMLVIVVTVLPVFCACCPYKSPVGWACILAKSALFSLWNRLLDLAEAVGDSLDDNSSFDASEHHLPVMVEKDWRGWDLARQTWRIDGTEWSEPVSLALGQHRMLFRALFWIQENSQDQRLMAVINDELASRRATNPSLNTFQVLVADVYLVCEHLGIDLADIVPHENQCAVIVPGDRVVRVKRKFIPTLFTLQHTHTTWSTLAPDGEWCDRDLSVDAPFPVLEPIAQLLASDLLGVVANYNEEDIRHFGNQADYFLQAAYCLGVYAVLCTNPEERRPSEATDPFFELADRLFRSHITNSPRFQPIIRDLLFSLNGYTHVSYPYTRHALNIPHGQPDNWSKADCSIFARISQSALEEWQWSHDHDTTMVLLPRLSARMAACVRRCYDQGWTDCGVTSGRLWWPSRLRNLYSSFTSLSSQCRPLPAGVFPYDLIDALGQYSDAGLITDQQQSYHMMWLVENSIAFKNQHMASQHAEDGANNARHLENSSSGNAQSRADVPPQIAAGPSTLEPPETTAPVHPLEPLSLTSSTEAQLCPPSDDNMKAAHDATSLGSAAIEHGPEASPLGPVDMLKEDLVLPVVSDVFGSTFPVLDTALPFPSSLASSLGRESSLHAQDAQLVREKTTASISDGIQDTSSLFTANVIETADGGQNVECDSSKQEAYGTITIPYRESQEISSEMSSVRFEGAAVGPSCSAPITEHLRSKLLPPLESVPVYDEHGKRNDTHISSTIEPVRENTNHASSVQAATTNVSTRAGHHAAASIAAEMFQDSSTTPDGDKDRDELEMGDFHGTRGYGGLGDESMQGGNRARAGSSEGNLARNGTNRQ